MNTTWTEPSPAPSATLDASLIRRALAADAAELIEQFDLAAEVASTNSELLLRAAPAPGRAVVLIAERQTAGRGRRGRAWLASPGEVLCLSVGWTYAAPPAAFAALSLVVGLRIAAALDRLGAVGVGVKWPNDLVVGQRKLGGILIETLAGPADAVYVVAGVGLNLQLSEHSRQAIHDSGTEPVDLLELTAPAPAAEPSFVAARLIEALLHAMQRFTIDGLQSCIGEWNRLDKLRGLEVVVRHGDATTRGIARGIDLSGALLVETPGELLRFISGEVSVRPAA